MFQKGQIVKGVVAGVFVVLGTKVIGGEQMIAVKPVNPADHSQVGSGQLCLPADKLIAV